MNIHSLTCYYFDVFTLFKSFRIFHIKAFNVNSLVNIRTAGHHDVVLETSMTCTSETPRRVYAILDVS